MPNGSRQHQSGRDSGETAPPLGVYCAGYHDKRDTFTLDFTGVELGIPVAGNRSRTPCLLRCGAYWR